MDWTSLKKIDKFNDPRPTKPRQKKEIDYPSDPIQQLPEFTFWEKLIPSKKEKKILETENKYKIALSD